ncbi:hypothetical protein NM688_g8765 [Phlebia brevispora]|uniref:Uncharacterized protein n=1 Tax=Phlebia brevispora TaxID=194682 RepID=A0ACC1RNL4_9APHY|nr:hypothetical protein NM688_g8765 [Phlebia brevispora]
MRGLCSYNCISSTGDFTKPGDRPGTQAPAGGDCTYMRGAALQSCAKYRDLRPNVEPQVLRRCKASRWGGPPILGEVPSHEFPAVAAGNHVLTEITVDLSPSMPPVSTSKAFGRLIRYPKRTLTWCITAVPSERRASGEKAGKILKLSAASTRPRPGTSMEAHPLIHLPSASVSVKGLIIPSTSSLARAASSKTAHLPSRLPRTSMLSFQSNVPGLVGEEMYEQEGIVNPIMPLSAIERQRFPRMSQSGGELQAVERLFQAARQPLQFPIDSVARLHSLGRFESLLDTRCDALQASFFGDTQINANSG